MAASKVRGVRGSYALPVCPNPYQAADGSKQLPVYQESSYDSPLVKGIHVVLQKKGRRFRASLKEQLCIGLFFYFDVRWPSVRSDSKLQRLFPFGIDNVDCASDTAIERMNEPEDVHDLARLRPCRWLSLSRACSTGPARCRCILSARSSMWTERRTGISRPCGLRSLSSGPTRLSGFGKTIACADLLRYLLVGVTGIRSKLVNPAGHCL